MHGMVLSLLRLCAKYFSEPMLEALLVDLLLTKMFLFQIADDMVPPWLLRQILIGVANFLPKLKLVPQKDLAEAAFRELKKRELVCLFIELDNSKDQKYKMLCCMLVAKTKDVSCFSFIIQYWHLILTKILTSFCSSPPVLTMDFQLTCF